MTNDVIHSTPYHLKYINRGYYMAARRYEIYLRVLKNITRVSAANEWNNFQHEKKNFVSPSDHVIFFLLYKMWRFSEDFRPFSEDFRRFSKIGQNAGRTFPNIFRRFPDISRRLPKITEDCRRRPKKIRRCFDHTPTNLSLVKGSKHHSSGTDIFTCEDISSHVRISYRFFINLLPLAIPPTFI